MSTKKSTISADDLIAQVKKFFKIDARITFDLPEYEKFHQDLQTFIYENHFEDTPEWDAISNNLIYKSNQHMVAAEANAILVQLELLKRRILAGKYNPMWNYIHPRIAAVSKSLYGSGHYANAAEDAFIEINDRVKKLFDKINPSSDKTPDGDKAMTTVFSANKPMIQFCDQSTETGFNTQKGYMEMLTGAISALRNPKAHSNSEKLSAEETLRRLMFASMLMYKIDEAVTYSQIYE